MTTQHQSDASKVATNTFTKLIMVSLMFACVAVFLMALHISNLNDRLVAQDKAWAAAAKPIADARAILPAIKSPEDLANALNANYHVMPVKTGVMMEDRETEIVIRYRRTLGELLREDERFHEMLKEKPSF